MHFSPGIKDTIAGSALPDGAATEATLQSAVFNLTTQISNLQDLDNKLSFLLDRLEYGTITDNAKRLKVNIEAGTLPAVTTVSTVSSVTNTVRQGDLQIQRVNEALLDSAFINGITNNLSIT